jgi:hypothetical protein
MVTDSGLGFSFVILELLPRDVDDGLGRDQPHAIDLPDNDGELLALH